MKSKKKPENIFKTIDNENTTLQSLWDVAKAGLQGQFTVIQAFLRSKKNLKQPNLPLRSQKRNKQNSKSAENIRDQNNNRKHQ